MWVIALLVIIFCLIQLYKTEIIIQDSGVSYINENDIALIIYITLQNTYENNFEIVVNMLQCCLEKPDEKDCNSMALIGGDMGILKSKSCKNVTLIFPNLYLNNRKGSCRVSIDYRDQHGTKQIIKEICFQTMVKNDKMIFCNTDDLDQLDSCSPVDCTIKYSGWKSYFNHNCNKCQSVPFCISSTENCLPDVLYSTVNNGCKDLNLLVGKNDLEAIENNKTKTNVNYNVLSNVACHHGTITNNDECECFEGWSTTPNDEDDYEPRLAFYHMCNVEVGAWNSVNKNRIKTTALIIAIFAVTIASKILILMCILNWCYKYIKKPFKRRSCTDEENANDKSLILCEEDFLFDKCTCINPPNSRKGSLKAETVHVNFYPFITSSALSTQKSEKSSKHFIKMDSVTKTSSFSTSYSYTSGPESDGTLMYTDGDDFEIEFSEGEEEQQDEESVDEEEIEAVEYAGSPEEEGEEDFDEGEPEEQHFDESQEQLVTESNRENSLEEPDTTSK